MPLLHVLGTFVISFVAYVPCTVSWSEVDYPSDEDSTYEPPPDDSVSAMKHGDSWSVQESEMQSSGLSDDDDGLDNDVINNVDLSLDEKPKQTDKNSVLLEVGKKVDKISRNLERAVGIANKKMNDWSRRIYTFRSNIFGPNGPNGQNGQNAYGGDPYGNGNGFGGGGGYGGNSFNRNGGGSIVGAYNTIWPFFQELRMVLSKIIQFSGDIASRLFLGPSMQARGPRRRPRPGDRKPPYQDRGRGGRGFRPGGGRMVRPTTTTARQQDDYAAYDTADY